MRHDNIRDFLAATIQKIQNDVETEPTLQKIEAETIPRDIGNTSDEARVDIRAKGFWRAAQDAYFDVRVMNPLAASNMNVPLADIYNRHEKEKKRAYNHRIISIEHGTFTPLVFSILGTAGPECQVFLKRLFHKVATKKKEEYNTVVRWMRTKLSFMCIKACLTCLRGTRVKRDVYTSEDIGGDSCEAGLQ